MPRRVFFSFHYQEDIWRVNQIRHVGVTRDWEAMPFLDAASWEAVKRKGEKAVTNWIDRQLDGTGVTVVLIGPQTAERKFVNYEIQESHRRGNGLLGIYIHGLKNREKQTSYKGRNPFDNFTTEVEGWFGPTSKRLSDIYPTYDWNWDGGYESIGKWIEDAAVKAGR
jgi:hypothetical protein